jgi:hypothetical protein
MVQIPTVDQLEFLKNQVNLQKEQEHQDVPMLFNEEYRKLLTKAVQGAKTFPIKFRLKSRLTYDLSLSLDMYNTITLDETQFVEESEKLITTLRNHGYIVTVLSKRDPSFFSKTFCWTIEIDTPYSPTCVAKPLILSTTVLVVDSRRI